MNMLGSLSLLCIYISPCSVFQLSNKGPSGMKSCIIKIAWPSHDERGMPLLQLDGLPVVSRPDISCLLLNDSVLRDNDNVSLYMYIVHAPAFYLTSYEKYKFCKFVPVENQYRRLIWDRGGPSGDNRPLENE